MRSEVVMAVRGATLRVRGRDVAHYVWQPDVPLATSPRPYLHPVRTLAGTVVTDAAPDSHPHQFGISIAAPDIDGRNFWGGRSFVAGHGPAWLDNHGIQRHQRWLRHTDTELAHQLQWIDPRHAILLREQRTITCRPVDETAWALGIETRLTNATERLLTIRSPAALGRHGAGYGGFFWRGPALPGPAKVISPVGGDVAAVHGGTAAWVGVTSHESPSWSVLFVPGNEASAKDRWFVRARDYLGVGSSLTWDQPLVLTPGESLTRHIIMIIVDGVLAASAADALASTVRASV